MAEYMYKYADGTTGSSPYQKDASGNFIYTPGGSIIEGQFLGTGNGSGGYTPGLNAAAAGLPLISNGNGNAPQTSYNNTKPLAVDPSQYYSGGGAGEIVNTKPLQISGGATDTLNRLGGEVISTRPTQIDPSQYYSGAPTSGGGSSFGGVQVGSKPGGSNSSAPTSAGVGGISGYTSGQNPYLQQMGDALVQQNTQNLQRNVLPRVGSAAMAAGGYGGSRQGVVESNAISDLNTANANGLASLYGGAYNTNLQYDLGRRSQDQSYDLGRRNNDLGYFGAANSYNLGMGNLGLGYAGLDRQIANDNASWGQQGYNNNMGLWGQMVNNNNTGINAATGIQNNPLNYWQQFGNQYNSIGQGYGTSTSSGGGGNPIAGALGGAQLGSQIGNWWNGGGGPSTANGYGNGTMSDLAGYGVF